MIVKQFHSILHRVCKSGNREALTNALQDFYDKACWMNATHYFHWGFEKGYMWVRQRGHITRLIYVPILNEHI